MISPTPSVGDAIDRQAKRLATAGIREPRRQAAALWAWLNGTSVGNLWLIRGDPAGPTALERFEAAVERRLAGEPLPYVVGMAGFRTLELEVDSRVLIPRPETEGLVDLVLEWARKSGRWGAVVDIGTGSGCIALALAVEGHFTQIVATDVSAAALEVAGRNVERVRAAVPIRLARGTLTEPLGTERFDAIVSNPPYVSEPEFERLDDSVRSFEPRTALVGGRDGMYYIEQLVGSAHEHVLPRGLLAIEVDAGRAEQARALADESGWTDTRIEPDLFGRPRYLLATREP